MDKNKGFYEVLKDTFDGAVKFRDANVAGCISSACQECGTTIDEYNPGVDHHKVYDIALEKIVNLRDEMYAVGFNKAGDSLADTRTGMVISASLKKLTK